MTAYSNTICISGIGNTVAWDAPLSCDRPARSASPNRAARGPGPFLEAEEDTANLSGEIGDSIHVDAPLAELSMTEDVWGAGGGFMEVDDMT